MLSGPGNRGVSSWEKRFRSHTAGELKKKMSVTEVPTSMTPAIPKMEGTELKPSISQIEAKDSTELPELKNKSCTIDNSKPLPTSLQNDFIPEEIFLTLTSASKTANHSDHLGPLKKAKTPKDFQFQDQGLRAVDHVWHHPVRRTKFKYLTEQPVSMTGAGRDISFLCDVMLAKELEKTDLPVLTTDKSAVRAHHGRGEKQKPELSLPQSLVPEEFHIVKNKGVLGLEYYEDKYTTLLVDDEKKLRVFPSMKPSGRLEVIQLMKVMEAMLQKAGVDDEEIEGPTQMHSLLELVKKEQNIYNIIFHEVIRQVSVECAERGELLAKLRQRYVNLLDRIPKQVKSLQTEILAHRAMDRHLTEELNCFQNSIMQLSRELFQLRERDLKLTAEVKKAQEELAVALLQAQKDANLLDEYHGLYELQRHRLEEQVMQLAEEKDLWCSTALKLAIKVIERNNLHLAKRLHIIEKSWVQLVGHFISLLASKDVSDMAAVQEVLEEWRELMKKFTQEVEQAESSCREKLRLIRASLSKWQQHFKENVLPNEEHRFCTLPGDELKAVLDDVKHWEEMLMRDFESFGGETLLANQETLKKLSKLQKQWTELGQTVFARHPGPTGESIPEQKQLEELNETVKELCHQWSTRVSGENGLSRSLMAFANALEHWSFQLSNFVRRPGNMLESDWKKLSQQLSDCLSLVNGALLLIGSTQKEEDRQCHRQHVSLDLGQVLNALQNWIMAAILGTEKEGAGITQEVASIHTEIIHWLVNMLLHLVPDLPSVNLPDVPESSRTSKEAAILTLEEDAKQLAVKLDRFSTYIIRSCRDIVDGNVKERKAKCEEDPEYELRELEKIKEECAGWIETCQFLLSDLKNGPVQSLPLGSGTEISSSDSVEALPVSEQQAAVVPDEQNLKCTQETLEQEAEQLDFAGLDVSLQAEATEDTRTGSGAGEQTQEFHESSDYDMRVIGHDSNIWKKSLMKDLVPIGMGEMTVTRPLTARSQQNCDALVVIEGLQQQLLKTEEHAQKAETRAANLDEQLRAALEKIQALERQLKEEAIPEETAAAIPTVTATESKKESEVSMLPSAKRPTPGKQLKTKSNQKNKTSKP